MNIIEAQNLACPIDGDALVSSSRQLTCKNGHTFDMARQGYVNLLPVQHKRSKQPGDSKAMVVARYRFLDSGIYQPIAERLCETVYTQICDKNEVCLLDAGCGEGYYFDFLYNSLAMKPGATKLSFIGLDISKEAIIQSTKRNKRISWIVGTNRQPPIRDESVDIILCLFGFFSADGFNKILKPGGRIILVDPGPEHLKELREIIYPAIKKADTVETSHAVNVHFRQIDSEKLQFKTKIPDNASINDLLIMTPHFYRASKEGRDAACELSAIEITVDVIFRILEKNRP